MDKILYCEINILCMIILFFLLACLHESADQRTNRMTFSHATSATIVILALDSIWALIDGKPGKVIHCLNYIVNAAYMFGTGFISYLWFYYIESKLKRAKNFSKTYRLLLCLPLALLLILSFSSIFTHWMFYINESNHYQRGILYYSQVVLAYFYMNVAAVHVITDMIRTKSRVERREMSTLLTLFFFPFLGGISSSLFYGIPLLLPPLVLSILTTFLRSQTYQISTDSLTGLNNRRQLDAHLNQLLSDPPKNKTVVLFMMDIDRFKSINDTYGHYEGDHALTQTAAILKNTCRGMDTFLARYGGDEFAIVCALEHPETANELKKTIQAAFAARNSEHILSYQLVLSIGFEQFAEGHATTMAELISGADQALYREKSYYHRKKS